MPKEPTTPYPTALASGKRDVKSMIAGCEEVEVSVEEFGSKGARKPEWVLVARGVESGQTMPFGIYNSHRDANLAARAHRAFWANRGARSSSNWVRGRSMVELEAERDALRGRLVVMEKSFELLRLARSAKGESDA